MSPPDQVTDPHLGDSWFEPEKELRDLRKSNGTFRSLCAL